MMKLPVYTTPNPSVEWLRGEQARLRSQADRMIESTGIMDLFAQHGELSPIGGSYQYELMMYPDLDIDIMAETVTRQDFAILMGNLAMHSAVRGMSATDTINFNLSKVPRPRGYWIGLDIPFENDRWGVDCWLQQPDWGTEQTGDYTSRLIDLEQPTVDAILALKYELIRNGSYGKQYLSTDVYDAVLDHGIMSIAEFDAWAASR